MRRIATDGPRHPEAASSPPTVVVRFGRFGSLCDPSADDITLWRRLGQCEGDGASAAARRGSCRRPRRPSAGDKPSQTPIASPPMAELQILTALPSSAQRFLDAALLHTMASANTPPVDHDVELHDLSDLDSASHRSMSASSHSSFSKPPSSSATSYSSDAEMRSLSPAPSVYSMTNSLREQSYRVEFGRSLNNHSEVYRLPADPEELDRLGTWQFFASVSILLTLF